MISQTGAPNYLHPFLLSTLAELGILATLQWPGGGRLWTPSVNSLTLLKAKYRPEWMTFWQCSGKGINQPLKHSSIITPIGFTQTVRYCANKYTGAKHCQILKRRCSECDPGFCFHRIAKIRWAFWTFDGIPSTLRAKLFVQG